MVAIKHGELYCEISNSNCHSGCKPKSVTLYIKYGAPPVINPDGSKFPENFYLEGRPEMNLIEFKSDTTFQYINMSTPFPGSYYAAVFQTYTDPKNEGITQEGDYYIKNTYF